VDAYRGIEIAARRDGDEAPARELVADVELLVTGVDGRGVGEHPHLNEVDVVGLAVVDLGVADAPPGAHPLGQAGVDHATVALRIGVLQLTVEHPGDDLHVTVRVGGEARTGSDPIVVAHHQEAVACVRRVPVGPEAEAVLAVQPIDAGVISGGSGANVDRSHHCICNYPGERCIPSEVARSRVWNCWIASSSS
jgi:hypothetical protein